LIYAHWADPTSLAYLGYIDQVGLRLNETLPEAPRLRQAVTPTEVLSAALWIEWITCSPEKRRGAAPTEQAG
jgi:hypothetical protein